MKTYIKIVFELKLDLPKGIEGHEIFALLKKKYPKVVKESERFYIESFSEAFEINWGD